MTRTRQTRDAAPLRRRRTTLLAALLTSFALTAAACGGGDGSGAGVPTANGAVVDDSTLSIRVAMPAEPLWQWLIDSGTLASWETEHGLRIEASHPFKPFTALVSGDADIILINALDIPVFAQGLERHPIIIGKHAADRTLALTKRTSQAADLAALVEGKIAVESQLGSTLLWALIVDAAHELDLSYESQDFEFLVATFGLAAAVENGDAIACICRPDESAVGLSAAKLRPMYDGMPAAELYSSLTGDPETLMLGQVFLADRDWLDAFPSAASAFLMLWEQAVQHWQEHHAEVIRGYPDLLSLQTEAEVAWLISHADAHDWIVPTVYTTRDEADAYSRAVGRLQELGILDAEAEIPWVATEMQDPTAGR